MSDKIKLGMVPGDLHYAYRARCLEGDRRLKTQHKGEVRAVARAAKATLKAKRRAVLKERFRRELEGEK